MHSFALLSLLACGPGSLKVGDGPPEDTSVDTDTDTSIDTDTDTSIDTGSDTDTSIDTGTEPDTDVEPARVPTSCLDALQQDPTLTNGIYTIDPDGEGGNAAFDVRCNMDVDGGGWTQWWWFNQDTSVDWGSVGDVLGQELSVCDPAAGRSCFAHIPDAAAGELLATDGTDWAVWEFDASNSTSARAYNAFVNRQTSAYQLDVYTDAWNPARQSTNRLPASFACDANDEIAADGGCRNFWYQDVAGSRGTVRSFNLDDDGGYGQTAFGAGLDNSGRDYGCDIFEQTTTITNSNCRAALYYR
jgi:hypothetical protein